MYVVTKDGKKLNVDDSNIDYENDYVPFHQTVGLYTDDTELRPIWIVTVEKRTYEGTKYELEFVKEYRYSHKPTKEELLYCLAECNCTRYDVISVREAYELDMC